MPETLAEETNKGVHPNLFRNALGRFATGVCVVTAVGADGVPAGLTVSAFASLSLTPPLVLFCLDKATKRLEVFRESGAFGISVLSEGQRDVSDLFAGQEADKFAKVGHVMGENGCPLLDGSVTLLECARVAIHDGGDHIIFIARVDRVEVFEERPLLYYRGDYRRQRGFV